MEQGRKKIKTNDFRKIEMVEISESPGKSAAAGGVPAAGASAKIPLHYELNDEEANANVPLHRGLDAKILSFFDDDLVQVLQLHHHP